MTIQTGGVEHLTRTQRRICFLVVYRTVIRSHSVLRSISFTAKAVCACVASPFEVPAAIFSPPLRLAPTKRHSKCTLRFFLPNGSPNGHIKTPTPTLKSEHQMLRIKHTQSVEFRSKWAQTRFFMQKKSARVWIILSTNVCVCPGQDEFSFWSTRKPM